MYFILFNCFTFYTVSYISMSEFFHHSKSNSFSLFLILFSIDVFERRTLLYLFLRVSTSSLRAALSIWGKDKRRKDMTSFGISQDMAIFSYFRGVRGGPGDLLTLGRKNYCHIKNELVPVTFVNLIFMTPKSIKELQRLIWTVSPYKL